jgi:hypothetical protein
MREVLPQQPVGVFVGAARTREDQLAVRNVGVLSFLRMKSEVYWIETPLPGRLRIMARPRASEWLCDEVAGWVSDRIDVVVSLPVTKPSRACGRRRAKLGY